MRIGIDIRATQSHHKYRGIGRYTKSLVEGLSLIDNTNEYVLFGMPKMQNEMQLNRMNYVYVDVPVDSSILGKVMRLLFGPKIQTKQHKLDIFLQPDVFAGQPTHSLYKVAVFYDLIPFIFKHEYFNELKGYKSKLSYFRYIKGIKNYKKFDEIITISNSSKDDLITEIGIEASRVKVIYPGFDHESNRSVKPGFISKNDNYLLYVGSCDYRKNISSIVDAFEVLREKSIVKKLILVGQDFIESRDVQVGAMLAGSKFHDDIVTPGFVSEEELTWLYKNSAAYIYPSLYEGFGLPVVEAMAFACPVITFDNSSLREVGGDAAIYVETAGDIVEAVERLESDKTYRDDIVAKSIIQSKKFSWEKTSKLVLRLLERK